MANQNKLISVISPVYKSELIIKELVKRIELSLKESKISSFEIILVEDCSPDNSWGEIEEICNLNDKVVGIKLSKNTGQHNAIKCGLDHATGELIFVMDCDLQHDPNDFRLFLSEIKENGCDYVLGVYSERNHTLIKNITAYFFYFFYNKFSEVNNQKFNREHSGFVLMKRKVRNELIKIREEGSHFLLNLRLIGYNHSYVIINHSPRYSGSSSYSFSKLLDHAVNGLTAHSTKILRASIYLSGFMFLLSFFFAFITMYRYFYNNVLELSLIHI